MVLDKAYIPYDAYWSTPFCRWQGSFAHLHAMEFAADISKGALKSRGISPNIFDQVVLGMTVPQKSGFYGAPWMAAMIGATGVTGPMISQACATSAKCVAYAAGELELGNSEAILVVTCDRTSNGPHVYYPNPLGVGGTGDKEDWVWDNFGYDPYAKNAMIETAENVAKEAGITKEEQDEVAYLRFTQYQDALKDNSAFLNRYMVVPIDVKDPSGRKSVALVEGDEESPLYGDRVQQSRGGLQDLFDGEQSARRVAGIESRRRVGGLRFSLGAHRIRVAVLCPQEQQHAPGEQKQHEDGSKEEKPFSHCFES